MSAFDAGELGGRLRAVADELSAWSERLQSASAEAASGEYRAADEQGLAEVVVDGRPRLIDLRLHPDALREADTKWYEGAGILEAAMCVKDGISDGNYYSVGGNLAVVGLGALGTIMDPFQAIFAAGVGWLMEHVAILREPLDWLAGDPKEIEGHAQTWRDLQERT